MDVRWLYGKLREITYFTTLQEEMKYTYKRCIVSGIGVIPGTIPDDVRLRLSRRFRKRGRILFFEHIPVGELEVFKEYVVFLASEVRFDGEEIKVPKKLGVVWVEFPRNPKQLKAKFPAWEIVRGRIIHGRREFILYGSMRVPTYDQHLVVFIADAEDIERKEKIPEGTRITYPLRNLITRYRHGTIKQGHIIPSETLVIPIFSY